MGAIKQLIIEEQDRELNEIGSLRIPVTVERVFCNAVLIRIEASGKLVTVKPESLTIQNMTGVRVGAEYDGGANG